MILRARRTLGDFCLRYSEWMHIPSWMREVSAISEKMELKATWNEKFASSQSEPCQVTLQCTINMP